MIIDIMNEKTLVKKRKTEIGSKKIDGERKNLVEISCCSVFSGVKLSNILTACRLPCTLPKKQISGYLLASSFRKSN